MKGVVIEVLLTDCWQGRLEMWVDLFPSGPDEPPPPAPVDIKPRAPGKSVV